MGVRSWLGQAFGPEFRQSFAPVAERDNPYSLAQWYVETMNYGGLSYPLVRYGATPVDEIPNDFKGFAAAMAANPVVFGCMALRMRVFSEVRFDFRKSSDLHTTQMVGGFDGRSPANRDLELLRHPWPGGTTGDLLAQAEQHGMLAGNAFIYRGQRDRLRLLRPDWVSVLFTADPELLSWEIQGYVYHPGGKYSKKDPIYLDVADVAHYMPTPDPMSPWRGMSCLSPIVTDIRADNQATQHKLEWFEHGGTGTMVVELDNPALNDPAKLDKVAADFKARHGATANAYEVLFMANGADAKVIGSNLQQSDFKAIQGAGETRIAECFETPVVLVGLSEGLQGSSLNTGNYSAARRRFADGTIRPLWRNFCGSMEQVITTPPNAELWYDDADVGFLREDAKDQADIQLVNAQTIEGLIKEGFIAETAVEFVATGDFDVLKHTGLVSVQLQAPGSAKMPTGEVPGELPVSGNKPETLPSTVISNGTPKRDWFEDSYRAPDVHVEPHIQISFPELTFTTPPAPNVEVHTPEVRVDNQIDVPQPLVTVEAPHITVEPAKVEVTTPEVRVEPHIETPEVKVNVEPAKVMVPAPAPPVVNVTVPETKPTSRKVVRDGKGRIERIEED